jgi:hypothetical protein
MSIKLLSRIWDLQIDGNRRNVLQVLADYSNDDGICWPSKAAIAYKVGLKERQVINILNDLKSNGIVEVIDPGGRGPGSTTRVQLNLDAIPAKGAIYEIKGAISDAKGAMALAKIDPEPSLEPSSLEPPLARPKDRAQNLRQDFEDWYNHYPRKVGRADAISAFMKLNPDDSLVATMIEAVEAQKKQIAWLKDGGSFIPHPATWINGRRWEDEVGPTVIAPVNPHTGKVLKDV